MSKFYEFIDTVLLVLKVQLRPSTHTSQLHQCRAMWALLLSFACMTSAGKLIPTSMMTSMMPAFSTIVLVMLWAILASLSPLHAG